MDHTQPHNTQKDILYNQKTLPAEQTATPPDKSAEHIQQDECISLQCPQDIDISADKLQEFQSLAQEMNITSEQAQRLLDYAAAQTHQVQEAAEKTQHEHIESLIKQAQSDEEFGGAKMSQSIKTAQTALQALASDELIELLEDKGLGNHPEIIRLFYRIGQYMSEDNFVSANSGSHQSEKSIAEILYGA